MQATAYLDVSAQEAAKEARLHAARTAYIYDSAIVTSDDNGGVKFTSGEELKTLIDQLKLEIETTRK